MIKLNNKNITYVALADSNNSLKAPKEIWYADSNNSVKLVYRRKDALIEGEDYEKYHWLVADIPDNKRCIDLPINSDEISYSMLIQKAGNITFFETISNYRYYTTYGTIPSIKVWNITTSSDVSTFNVGLQTNKVFNITSNESSLTINGVEVQKIGFPISAVVLRSGATLGNAITETSSILVNGVERYIPCKLLKSVPKWLDANGIRRQVGECGMIDLISGKFYGNVNSVGTFTVENYYERKEHLVSTNAYIDTKLKNITDKNITISFSYALNTSQGVLFGSEVYSPTNRISMGHHLINDNFGIWFWDSNPGRKISDDYKNLTVILDATQSKTFVNGINITDYNPPQSELYNNILLFAYYRKQTIDSDAALVTSPVGTMIDNFIVQNTMNLIPCTLTMDLPASMDANNIARTKGTSGMWDLVSDRFYGNVASSGTFKAVNLVEGVDYEIHDWLVANIPIGVMTMRLFVNQSSSVNYTVNITTTSNSIPLFRTAINGNKEDYVYFNNVSKLNVWSYINGTSASVNTIYSNNGLYNIELSPSEFIINSISATKYGDAYTIVWYNNPMNNTVGVTYTSKITVDGVERYIPVKLLKSIPSKYDANGIARQAGECGMYDTVNDVFYGNVASSGSFTVSDDN